MSLKPAASFDGVPETGLKNFESTPPTTEPSDGPLELDGPESSNEEDLPAPAADAKMMDAGWKIQWNASLGRSI